MPRCGEDGVFDGDEGFGGSAPGGNAPVSGTEVGVLRFRAGQSSDAQGTFEVPVAGPCFGGFDPSGGFVGSRACASSGACAGPARRAERNRHTSPGNNSLNRVRPGRTEPRAPRSLSRAHHAQPKTAAVFGPSPRAHRGRRKPDTNRGATSRDTGQFVRDRGVRLARRSQQHDLGALRQSGTDSKTPSSGIVPQDHHQRRVA